MKRFSLSASSLLCLLLIPVLLSSCASGTKTGRFDHNSKVGQFTDSWQTVPLLPLVNARVSMPGVPGPLKTEKDMMFIGVGAGGEMYAVMSYSNPKAKLSATQVEKEMMPMMAQMLSGESLQMKKISERDIVVQGRKGRELVMARQFTPRVRMIFHIRMIMDNDREFVMLMAGSFDVPAVKSVIERFMGSLKFNE